MSYTTTVHPPPRGHLEFSRNCGATQEQRDEIFDFLLLKAPQSSTTRQFALGGFTGHCPERTGWTVAVVKKLWHGWGRETWFTTELQFRRTKDGPMLATLGTSHLHRNLRETRRTPGQRHHFERPSGSDLERVTYRAIKNADDERWLTTRQWQTVEKRVQHTMANPGRPYHWYAHDPVNYPE